MNRNEIVYVNIHGNPVPTVLHNGKPHVGMKALCEQMGLDWEGPGNGLPAPGYDQRLAFWD